MRARLFPVCAATLLVLCASLTDDVRAFEMGTAFTYQGQLTDDGSPGSGEYDFQFRLCRDDACTDVVGTVVVDSEPVTDGLFTVELDFGADAFTGEARWLELGVRPGPANDPEPYETLEPRQELTPAPHALRAKTGVGGPDALNVNTSGEVGIGTSPMSNVKLAVDNPAYLGYAVEARAADEGTALYGNGGGNGVWGQGGGTGVTGRSDDNIGVWGLTAGTTGKGIRGTATSGSGNDWAGYFEGRGYFSDDVGIGTYPASNIKLAVDNPAQSGTGISSIALDQGVGLYGNGGSAGVVGQGGSFGVAGTGDAIGVSALGGGTGVLGQGGSTGVSGTSVDIGVRGTTTGATGKGVYGQADSGSGDDWAGYFDGRGYFSDDVGIGMIPGSNTKLAVYEPAAVGTAIEATAADNNGTALRGHGGHTGVLGTGDIGVRGRATGATGKGVYGEATSGSGNDWAGYFIGRGYFSGDVGIGTSPASNTKLTVDNPALLGLAIDATAADNGTALRGNGGHTGVSGEGGFTGVFGISTNFGVRGKTTGVTGKAVYGQATSGSGDDWAGYFDGRGYFSGDVGIGTSPALNTKLAVDNPALSGLAIEATAADNGTALRGNGGHTGVLGTGDDSGVRGTTTAVTGKGIYGSATSGSGNDWAGYFDGRGYFSGHVGIGTSPSLNTKLEVDNPALSGLAIKATAADNGTALYGSGGHTGVLGTGDDSGVRGTTTAVTGKGIYGSATSGSGNDWAGYFDGRGYFSGHVGIGTDAGSGAQGRLRVDNPAYAGVAIYGTAADFGTGVHGIGSEWGVVGGSENIGVLGMGDRIGVTGTTTGVTGKGIHGSATSGSGTDWAGYFDGRGYFSGNVGIGREQPEEELVVESSDSVITAVVLSNTSSDESYFVQVNGSSITGREGNLEIWAGAPANNLLTGTPDGLVGIGRDPGANDLEVEGTASKTTAGSWLANSDARIKNDVTRIENALGAIDRLRPVRFRYTDEYRAKHPSIEDREYVNFVAQEYREVFPEVVKDSGEDGLLQIDTHPASIYVVAAVQELHEIVKRKDAEIAQLEARLAALEQLMKLAITGQEGGVR